MRLYMKQKVFSLKERFAITDDAGRMYYEAEGEIFTLGKKLHLYDHMGAEVAQIRQVLLSFLPRYEVWMGGEQMAEIVKEFTFLTPKYTIKGPEWSVEGQIWAHDYMICKNGVVIANVHKAWMSWGDSYEIDIDENESETMVLAVVLAIDAVLDAQDASAASVNT